MYWKNHAAERRSSFFIVAAIVLAGCPTNDVDAPEDDVAVCLQGEPFVADGNLPLESPREGIANYVAELRWEDHEGCERFVIDLTDANGAAADGAGEVRAEVIRRLGVVRISLRDVEYVDPDATDAEIGGTLAGSAYVMWSGEGRWVDVDLHLATEAEAHVSVLQDPARVVVDLRPGGEPLPDPAITGERVVVLDPRPGPASYPLTASGYARTFEANVVARLVRDDEVEEETFTTATAWADAWGNFELTFEEGPSGAVELHVGEHSAKDGTWEGVVVPLEID